MRTERTALRLNESQMAEAYAHPDAYDSGPRRPPIARRDKHFNEHLGPLRNFLEGQVGRPWNKVYSEIRRTIDTRSVIGRHVLQHLEDFVATDALIENGRLVKVHRWGGVFPVDGLYVHPVTGILRRTKPRSRNRWFDARTGEHEKDFVRVSQTLEYQKLNDCWFRMEFRLNDPEEAAVSGPRTLIDKRQCDRKTVRRIEAGQIGGLLTNKAYFYRTMPYGRR